MFTSRNFIGINGSLSRASAAPNQVQLGLALSRPNGTLIYTSNLIQCSTAERIIVRCSQFPVTVTFVSKRFEMWKDYSRVVDY